jgi:hypothetical protein
MFIKRKSMESLKRLTVYVKGYHPRVHVVLPFRAPPFDGADRPFPRLLLVGSHVEPSLTGWVEIEVGSTFREVNSV